jgi:hypothetical protein
MRAFELLPAESEFNGSTGTKPGREIRTVHMDRQEVMFGSVKTQGIRVDRQTAGNVSRQGTRWYPNVAAHSWHEEDSKVKYRTGNWLT